jgi:hypothetical protein
VNALKGTPNPCAQVQGDVVQGYLHSCEPNALERAAKESDSLVGEAVVQLPVKE